MKKIYIGLCLCLLVFGSYAQTNENMVKPLEKNNNVGFGLGMAYMVDQNTWAPGIHIHYDRSLGEKKRISIGAGSELLMGDDRHTSLALSIAYRLTEAISVGYSPGLEFHLDDSEENGAHFAQHIEISYEFDLDWFHIGPMLEYGFCKEDAHLMFGIHTGFGF